MYWEFLLFGRSDCSIAPLSARSVRLAGSGVGAVLFQRSRRIINSGSGRRESESSPGAPGRPGGAPGQYAGTNSRPTRASAALASQCRKTDRARCLVSDGGCESLGPDPVPPTMPRPRMPQGRIRRFSQAEFRDRVIQRHTPLAFQRSQETSPHVLGLQQVGSFALRCDLSPKSNGDDNRCGLAGLVRHDLNIGVRHAFILTLRRSPAGPAFPGTTGWATRTLDGRSGVRNKNSSCAGSKTPWFSIHEA